MDWMLLPFKRYAEFTGRSRRMEYWMFSLLYLLVFVVAGILMAVGGLDLETLAGTSTATSEPGPLFYVGAGIIGLFFLGSFIPGIAVTIRRFHDRDMSGWWVLGFAVLGVLPFVGWLASIAQLVIMALPGTKGPNRFGDDPIDPNSADVFS